MNESVMSTNLFAIFYDVAIFITPPLLLATVVAFLVGLFQAVTQIQEQTLPQTIKIFVIGFVLMSMGPLLAAPLYTTSNEIFSNFHRQSTR